MELLEIICKTSFHIEIYDNNNEIIAKSDTLLKEFLFANVLKI